MEHLGQGLAEALVGAGQGLVVHRGEVPPVVLQGLDVADAGEGHVRRQHVHVKRGPVRGEVALVAAGRPVQGPEELIEGAAQIGPRLIRRRPAAQLAQQVKEDAGRVHHQLLLELGHDAAPQILPALAGVGQLLRLDDGPVPAEGAAQHVVRRHVVVVAGLGHKGQTRLPNAVLIVAEQGLTDAQVRRRLPLAYALLLPQQGQDPRKIRLHVLSALLAVSFSLYNTGSIV